MTEEELDPTGQLRKELEEVDWDAPEEDELAAIVPSRYVREYIQKTGWTFTDFQKAALLVNGLLPLRQKYTRLKTLGQRTEDERLREQITAHLKKRKEEFGIFCRNDGRKYIYTLEVEEPRYPDPKETEYVCKGYFFDWALAMAYGKKQKRSFRVEKHLIADRTGLTQIESGCFNPYLCPGKPEEELLVVEERDYDGSLEGELLFSPEGEASSLWVDQRKLSVEDSYSMFDPDLFENIFFPPPNPFERGDVVQLLWNRRYGVVRTSQKDWKVFLERQRRWEYHDFSDASIIVDFLTDDGRYSHSHINPVFLERYRSPCDSRKEWAKASPKDRLLWAAGQFQQGNSSLEELFDCIRDYQAAVERDQKMKKGPRL